MRCTKDIHWRFQGILESYSTDLWIYLSYFHVTLLWAVWFPLSCMSRQCSVLNTRVVNTIPFLGVRPHPLYSFHIAQAPAFILFLLWGSFQSFQTLMNLQGGIYPTHLGAYHLQPHMALSLFHMSVCYLCRWDDGGLGSNLTILLCLPTTTAQGLERNWYWINEWML